VETRLAYMEGHVATLFRYEILVVGHLDFTRVVKTPFDSAQG
jgi:hypothetical protein